jgi:hypothetical protein
MALGDALLRQVSKNADKISAEEPKTTTNRLKSKAALIISVFAAIYSINAFIGSQMSSRILNNTIQANDVWSFYQAKSVKQSLYVIGAEDIEMVLEDKNLNADSRQQLTARLAKYKATIARYESEPATGEGKKELMAKAHKIEAERDHTKKQAPWIGVSGSVMQISIVLLTASILSAGTLMFWAGLASMAVAIALMAQGMFLWTLPFIL